MTPSDNIGAGTYNPAMDPAVPLSRRWPRIGRSPHDAEILRLAVPAFGALVAEPLFLLADSAIVGRIGTTALGGLGVAAQALTTLVNVSIFLACGTTAAVARQLGPVTGRRPSGRGSTACGWPGGSGSWCSRPAGRWPRRSPPSSARPRR
jgi:MatE